MITGEDLGYLVMIDAPVPEKDPMGFRFSSVDMQVIVTEAKMIQSQHVLFMFDSCFSGSILNLRERVVPEAISASISLPVRQFITAGRANEPVPDHSIFKQAFLDLLEGRDKEPIPDGYITGEELGLYLKNKVPEYNPMQHPQYGKVKDIRLDKGDFVFALKMEPSIPSPAIPESGGIRDYAKIIEEREANRKKWDLWQGRMEDDFAKVELYDKSSSLKPKEKAEAWEGLLASYNADNPYTVKDDEFREKATERNRYWKEYKESGELFVDTVPSGAQIWVNKKLQGYSPILISELKFGTVIVRAEKEGYETWEESFGVSQGESKKIKKALEKSPDPENVDSLLRKAKLKEQSNDIEGAVACYKQILEISPNHEEASDSYLRLRLSDSYWHNMQTVDEAVSFKPNELDGLHIADSLRPSDGHSHLYDLAFASYEQGKYEKAITEFEKFVGEQPGSEFSDDAQFWMGEAYMAQQKYEHAILAYADVMKKYPQGNKVPHAMLREALAFTAIKDFTSSKLLMEKLIREYPESNAAKIARTKLTQSKVQLYVNTEPSNARVRIMNIEPKYKPGIELEPGKYDIEVFATGYVTWRKWVELIAGEGKQLKVELEHMQPATQPEQAEKESLPQKSSVSKTALGSDAVERDGAYVAYANGIVKDTKTGLEWKAGPDRDMDWNEARSWVKSLGGDWRMPTLDELMGLYKEGKGDRNRTPLLKSTGWGVWSGKTNGSSKAWFFPFRYSFDLWHYWERRDDLRAFAVRSRSDG